jgi:beta-galactosidase
MLIAGPLQIFIESHGWRGAAFYAAVSQWVSDLANVKPLLDTPIGVEVTEKASEKWPLLFLMNHSDFEKTVKLNSELYDLLDSEKAVSGTLTLVAKGVSILLRSG